MAKVMDLGYEPYIDTEEGDRLYMMYHGEGGFQYASPASGAIQKVDIDPEIMRPALQRWNDHANHRIQAEGLGISLPGQQPKSGGQTLDLGIDLSNHDPKAYAESKGWDVSRTHPIQDTEDYKKGNLMSAMTNWRIGNILGKLKPRKKRN